MFKTLSLSVVMFAGLAQAGDVVTQETKDAKAATLSDPKIATIALTAHEIDISEGKLAQKRASNDLVKQFADAMVKDHEAGRKEVKNLANKLKVKLQQSQASRDLKKQADQTHARLSRIKGGEFDRAYIESEIAYHQAVIDTVQNTLIPTAQNADLKQALENTVPTLQGHLKHAQNVQDRLTEGVGGTGDQTP